MTKRLRVVFAGGGFAATEAAKGLVDRAEVTVVAPEPRFTYLPLVHEFVSEETPPQDASRPLAEVLPGARIVQASAERVEGNDLVTDSGERIPFDRLVVAIGARTNYFGTPGAREHTLPLWSLADGLEANGKLKHVLAAALVQGRPAVVNVVGGGATGIEVAGEVATLFRRYGAPARIRVIEALPEIFRPFSDEFRHKVREALDRLGIELVTSAKVDRADEHAFHVRLGEDGKEATFEHDLAFWCAGVKGRVLEPFSMQVRSTMQSVERDDVFIAGDCAKFPKEMGRVPQLAQTAVQQGELLVRNVLDPARARPYEPRIKGILVSIGPGHAVAEMANGTVLAGRIPWHIKKALYKYKLATAGT